MTEYDYSPDAYRRHLENQARIAKWVDNTQSHSNEFREPFGPPPPPGDSGDSSPEDDLVTPGQSISQYNPSPPAHPHYPPPHHYPHHLQPHPQGYYGPLPGPTPYNVYPPQPTPHRHSSSHRSRSHPRKSSRSHRSLSPTYIITSPPGTLPGPTPYGYPPVPAAPGSIMAMSPPVSPGIPGVPQPSFVVIPPRGKKVQVVSPPISPPPPSIQQAYSNPNAYLHSAYAPGPYPQAQQYPPQPYPQAYRPPPPPAQPPSSAVPTYIPASAHPQYLNAPMSRGNTLKKSGTKGYSYLPEWRRSF